MPAFCQRKTSHSFYILMVDYGKGPERPMGLEAIVQPELTRADIVAQARYALQRHDVAFVKFVDGNFIEDRTDEILAEARLMLEAAE